ncbi:hypothetical protein Bca4012_084283 [Brassica carinata]
MRCRNWKGSGKVSYQDITSLESHFDKGELFAFISSTGNFDVIDSDEFFRKMKRRTKEWVTLGTVSRKKQLLCQRGAEHNSGVSGEMKTFIEVGKGSASEIQCPSATFGKDQGNSSHSPAPSAAKVKGKAAANVDPTLLDEIERMAEHQARLDEEIEDLRISMKKTVQEEVMNHNNVGCVGTLFGLLCLWSKYD